MTNRQRLFVENYLIDLNATQAAIRAGLQEADRIGYYVYFLTDPNTGNIFYVGKGKGKRCDSHLKVAKKGKIDNVPKYDEINRILATGRSPEVVILFSGMRESDAYEMEKYFIENLKDCGLKNIQGGIECNEKKTLRLAEDLRKRMRPLCVWLSILDEETMKLIRHASGNEFTAYADMANKLDSLIEKLKNAEFNVKTGTFLPRDGCVW